MTTAEFNTRRAEGAGAKREVVLSAGPARPDRKGKPTDVPRR